MRAAPLRRFWAVLVKEFIQMRRDRLSFAMMTGIPILQLIIFGYAINFDPQNLPTAVVMADESVFSRSVVRAMENSGYFEVIKTAASEKEAEELLDRGGAQFVLNIPEGFSRRILRGERPSLLLEADATDPVATANAISAVVALSRSVLDRDMRGPLGRLIPPPPPVELIVHRKFNPEGITSRNIVPGLLGVVLTMTMVLITGVAMTRERERGTMEKLLSTPARPIEVMLGKIVPYIIIGYMQVGLVLLAAHFLFGIPFAGSLPLLLSVMLLFIAANLSVGFTFSTIAKTQFQAMQMSFLFFLPSIMLSGFMFPFRGMPQWAQWIGSALPLTHFLRLVRGILLKGNGLNDIYIHLWPIAVFMTLALVIARRRYHETLD